METQKERKSFLWDTVIMEKRNEEEGIKKK